MAESQNEKQAAQGSLGPGRSLRGRRQIEHLNSLAEAPPPHLIFVPSFYVKMPIQCSKSSTFFLLNDWLCISI